jgi:hypothetical protein
LQLTKGDLKPLFDILRGDSNPSSPRMLTPATKKVLQMISEVLHFAQVTQVDPDKPLYLLMLATDHTPTTLLWQEHGPLEMATSASGFCVLMPYYIRVSALIIKGCTHV